MNDYRLVILLAIPLVGAVAATFMPDARTTRRWALAISLATFAYSDYLAVRFFGSAGGGGGVMSQFRFSGFGVSDIGFALSLGVDSISLWLVLLTTGLTPLAIAASFGSIRERQKEYYAWMLALLVAM